MSIELIEAIKKAARQSVAEDDPEFMVNDWAGGNIDDAYGLGLTAGEALFARNLIKQFDL